ncbi:MAG: hydratase [Clostridiales bacterium]|nr:hydratase [Clostridiales bacterium]
MVKILNEKVFFLFNNECFPITTDIGDMNAVLYGRGYPTYSPEFFDPVEARKGSMTYKILTSHSNSTSDRKLNIKFDALASHDITYVGIIQTARASKLEKFPVPYVLTNCHNSLCAVGGTINEDDHRFGLSAAKKYGGIFVPAHQAVIHQYVRETMTGCGKMILGSDSHTRYGALGTMGIGEGGPELVKQILSKTYDIDYPEVIGVYLHGKPKAGVGPQDVALAIIGAVFKSGFVKNKVLEFVGDGIKYLSVDFRNGIDVMTTETTCLSSIWVTDGKVEDYYKAHGRPESYKKMQPDKLTCYDGFIRVDMDKIESMIALPFHPSNVYTIKELNENAEDILLKLDEESGNLKLADKIKDGKINVEQGIIAGCAGGSFENLCYLAKAVRGKSIGSEGFDMSVYPASQPIMAELVRNGAISDILSSGIAMKTAFCGPCFGACDTPSNNGLSIRHTTRNFPNREGSKPGNGQIASVALVDARSIAATAINHGVLTPATELGIPEESYKYNFDDSTYRSRVYQGYGYADESETLQFGPNITNWPELPALSKNSLIKLCSVIDDPVTTTDELIPSGETSSYRSNPLRLAEFTLSRKDPEYVGRAKEVADVEKSRKEGNFTKVKSVLDRIDMGSDEVIINTNIGSVIYAVKPGDGSAREQAASCQRVLGGSANIAKEYATKRYRSNLINWGMIPFTFEGEPSEFKCGDYVFVPNIRNAIESKASRVAAKIISADYVKEITLNLPELTDSERQIILDGCLINYYSRS